MHDYRKWVSSPVLLWVESDVQSMGIITWPFH